MTDVYFAIDAKDAAEHGVPTLADLLNAIEQEAPVPVAVVGQPPAVM
jgi:hypothetical protein